MKKLVLFAVIAAFGFVTGLGLEVIAEGQESKLQTLVNNVQINSFQLPILRTAELAEDASAVIENADVGFEIVPITIGEGLDSHFINIPVCKFHSAESILHETCVICILENELGEPVGEGRIDFVTELPSGAFYEGSTTLEIPMTDFTNIEDLDVKNIEAVTIKVCEPPDGTEGCTPGYWKQVQHFGSWPTSGPDHLDNIVDPITQNTLFSTIFGEVITIKTGTNDSKIDPSILEALGAKGGGINALARHTVAAYLNSLTAAFPLSAQAVIDAFEAAIATGEFNAQKDIFDEFNNLGCPFALNPLDNSEDPSFSETGGVDSTTIIVTPVTPFEKFVYSRDQLQVLFGDSVNVNTQTELNSAILLLSQIVDGSSYWVNDYHLDTITGQTVLDNTKDSINSLYLITISGNETVEFNDSIQAIIDELISASTILAQTAIDDVNACGGENPKIANHLSRAQTKLSQAITDSNDKKYDMALDKFFNAWFETFLATESCPDGYWTQLEGYEVVG